MPDLEDYFKEQTEEGYDHPLLRLVDELHQRPEVKDVRIEVVRPRDVLGFKPARMYLHLLDACDKEILPYQREEWDDALNAALIKRGIRAVSLENEKVRFALGLRAALQAPEVRFGDGYFNAVLVHHVMHSPFARLAEVAEVLKYVYRNSIDPGFRTYTECREMIDRAIRGRAKELTQDLKYALPEAEEVLAAALGQYLDERFSVTNRRVMGLL